jgi:hypothetical protein
MTMARFHVVAFGAALLLAVLGPSFAAKRMKLNLSTSRRQHEPLPSRLDPLERRDVRFGSLADIAA